MCFRAEGGTDSMCVSGVCPGTALCVTTPHDRGGGRRGKNRSCSSSSFVCTQHTYPRLSLFSLFSLFSVCVKPRITVHTLRPEKDAEGLRFFYPLELPWIYLVSGMEEGETP